MNFSLALTQLKDGYRCTRRSWPANTWVAICLPHTVRYFAAENQLSGIPSTIYNEASCTAVFLRHEADTNSPWVPQHVDLLAEDWVSLLRLQSEKTPEHLKQAVETLRKAGITEQQIQQALQDVLNSKW